MALLLTSIQCFFIGVIIFGFVGFLRGWRRELVSMGFILVAVLFLFVGGAGGLAEFVLVRIPQIIGFATNGTIGPKPGAPAPPPPSPTQVLMVAVITLILAIVLGYLVGNNAFPSPKTSTERFLGIIPGVIAGFAVISYVSHLFASSPTISFALSTPNPGNLGSYIFIIFLVALGALLIGLIASRLRRSGGK
jgi:hypothetical protein